MRDRPRSASTRLAAQAALLVLAAAACSPRPPLFPEDQPQVQLSTDRVTLEQTADAFPLPVETVEITNAGTEPLPAPTAQVRYGDSPIEWLSARVSAHDAGFQLSLAPSPLLRIAAGTYRATVVVEAPVAVNPSSTVAVTLVVHPAASAPEAWAPGPPMLEPRLDHTTTALADGGLLVAGGSPGQASVERMDPITGVWSPVGSLAVPRYGHVAVPLADGRVFLAGGELDTFGSDHPSPAATWEIYDPAREQVVATGLLLRPRIHSAAALLEDGRVLLVGGRCADLEPSCVFTRRDAEIFDPRTSFSSLAEPPAAFYRAGKAERLHDGRILLTGGDPDQTTTGGTACELFDPATGHWSSTGALRRPRAQHGLALLADGRALAFGGLIPGATAHLAVETSSELYDPQTGRWSPGGTLGVAHRDWGERSGAVPAAVLPSGKVIAVAGCTAVEDVNVCDPDSITELYDATAAPLPGYGAWTWVAGLTEARFGHTVTVTRSGRVFAVGGLVPNPDPAATWETYVYARTPEHWCEP